MQLHRVPTISVFGTDRVELTFDTASRSATQAVDASNSIRFRYDYDSRLCEVSRGGQVIGRWSYDANGNRDAAATPA